MNDQRQVLSARTDLSGLVFGRLVVISSSSEQKRGHRFWLCRCECGVERLVRGDWLRRGACTSCGCNQGRPTHGGGRTRLYAVWASMRARCERPSDTAYKAYGARGIKVCERWATSFAAFRDDMGPQPTSAHSVDRIDNDGPYAPWNCRWATRAQQLRNTRRNVFLTVFGERKPLIDWAADPRCVVSYGVLCQRVRSGMGALEALTAKRRPRNAATRPGAQDHRQFASKGMG